MQSPAKDQHSPLLIGTESSAFQWIQNLKTSKTSFLYSWKEILSVWAKIQGERVDSTAGLHQDVSVQ